MSAICAAVSRVIFRKEGTSFRRSVFIGRESFSGNRVKLGVMVCSSFGSCFFFLNISVFFLFVGIVIGVVETIWRSVLEICMRLEN